MVRILVLFGCTAVKDHQTEESLGTDWNHYCVTIFETGFWLLQVLSSISNLLIPDTAIHRKAGLLAFPQCSQADFPLSSGSPSASSGQLGTSPDASLVQPEQQMWLLLSPWPSLRSTDLTGDPWTGLTLTLVTRPDLLTFLGDCEAVSHQSQGLFNAYLIHLPFRILHNGFKFYNFLLFKLHYFSLEVGSNIHSQPSFLFSYPAGFFYQADVMKKHVFITIFSF